MALLNKGKNKMQETRAWLDLPSNKVLTTPYDQLWGWVMPERSTVEIKFTALGQKIKHAVVRRPDLGHHEHAFGFSIFLDLPELTRNLNAVPNKIEIKCFDEEEMLCCFELEIKNVSFVMLEEQRISTLEKRKFIIKNSRITLDSPLNCKALSSLPDDWPLSPCISDKDDHVSAHFYGPSIQKFLSELPSGSMVLDAGAGFRKLPFPNVINLEIYDYPSTDILATGDQLPFEDGVFDAVLSLAVLEHVRDPFACAKEIERVLKPGGKAYAMIPFLQAEHGYPSHYFNATRFGAQELFRGMELEAQFLDPSNEPIFTVHQILRLYASGLTGQTKQDFLGMSVADFLGCAPANWLEHPIVSELDNETAYLIAWGTTSIFIKKPEND